MSGEKPDDNELEFARACGPVEYDEALARLNHPDAPSSPVELCRVYWGSHGCERPRGHKGPHLCLSCRTPDEEGWVGAPPYYGANTNFYGEDTP